jgi:dephospho-CoA kinase
MRIVITGSIGTGKSTVSKALHGFMPGYERVSADDLVHNLYAYNAQFQADLLTRFGTAARKEISDIVFAQPQRRVELETLSWAYLVQEVEATFAKENVIFEFPLYFEFPHWHGRADAVVVVGCDEATQFARVAARDGLSKEKFDNIIKAQLPLAEKVKQANIYLDTTGSLESVKATIADMPELLSVFDKSQRQHDGTKDLVFAAWAHPGRPGESQRSNGLRP